VVKRKVASFVCVVALLALAVAMGCGSKTISSGFQLDAGGPGPGTEGGMTMMLNQDAGPMFGTDGTAGDGPIGCAVHCSSDLHNVVDCNNNVITMCPADQGCDGTMCVPACQSATDNKSTIGCDYYSVTPDVISPGPGACFAAYIANTWTTPVTLTVDYGSQTLDPTMFSYIPSGTGESITYAPLPATGIPAGGVAIVFLDADPMQGEPPLNFACPSGINAAMTTDSAAHGTAMGTAFHITTSAPVVAYDIFPYGGGQSAVTSATLLLPTSSWDTNYIAVDAFAGGMSSLSDGLPFIQFVAQQDGTTVTINPTADIMGGAGVNAATQGTPSTYSLDKGQVLQFTQNNELIGSVVQSNHPIGAWGGITCLNIDLATCCCDSAHQQIPPVKALGNEYVAVRYRNRFQGMEESPPWRIVGAVNGTNLTYEPSAPPGAPISLGRGQTIQFDFNGPFVVKSQDAQHPFYMSAHMTGAETVNPSESDGRGDPEFVNIIPPQQWLNSYVFFTDPTYPETDLVLIWGQSQGGFADVTLDCSTTGGSKVVTGWMPVDTTGDYQYTRVDLVTGDFEAQGSCNNGRHEITSTAPFGLTIWGWGSAATGDCLSQGVCTQYVSYAYPAGASVQPINTVVVPPMAQ
jgi:hypothetical protein